MAEFPALPLWTDALIGDTYHLTPAEFGAYLRLLICAWRRPNCDLPMDDKFLGRTIGDPKNWHRLKPSIIPFFKIQGDSAVSGGQVYRQLRLVDERDYVARRKARASAGGHAKALKARHTRPANSMLNDCSNLPPTPTPTPNKKDIVSEHPNFNDFYSAYPKRQSRKTAAKAYARVRAEGVSHETILAGLTRAKRSDSRFKDSKYTPLPASWLNAGGYADEPTNVVSAFPSPAPGIANIR